MEGDTEEGVGVWNAVEDYSSFVRGIQEKGERSEVSVEGGVSDVELGRNGAHCSSKKEGILLMFVEIMAFNEREAGS